MTGLLNSLQCQDSVTVHQKIRPKDVPGTLLNMALLNLGSSDPNLRTAAYNQLCALTATFDLKIEVSNDPDNFPSTYLLVIV